MNRLQQIILKSPPYIYTLVITLAICWLTLAPKPLPDSDIKLFPGADKLVHAIMFGALAGAIYVDMRRRVNPLSKWACAITGALFAAVGGAIIEFLQMAMDMGRSAEVADFVADAIGAVAGVAIARKLFSFKDDDGFRCDCATESAGLDPIEEIYLEAFPPEERRPWCDILNKIDSVGSPFSLTVIRLGDRPVGLITAWTFERFVYIEHFAIDPTLRGKQLGSRALKRFCGEQKLPVVLEVEPSSLSNQARRRIRFYERMGFHAFPHFHYIQPPYAPGLPEVELMLMSNSPDIALEDVKSKLHSEVYGKK